MCPDLVSLWGLRSVSILGCMAGTTGLEPATSAVTGKGRSQFTEYKRHGWLFWRCKARLGTVIEHISNPQPLPHAKVRSTSGKACLRQLTPRQ
jgi:hypothetical protein